MRVKIIAGVLVALLTISMLVAQDTESDSFDETYGIGYAGEILTVLDPSAERIQGEVVEAMLEDITLETQKYYGAVVTVEGVIQSFVSAGMFSLGEGAPVDNDLVLVVNNSNHEFEPQVMKGAIVRVTGRIHPSHAEIKEGVDPEFDPLFADEEMNTTNAEDQDLETDTNESTKTRPNLVRWAQVGFIPDEYENYTILEILNIENLEFIDLPEAKPND